MHARAARPAQRGTSAPRRRRFNDQFPLPQLLGQDVSRHTLSWARAAGGILSTTSDMTRWERALYSGHLLPPQQQAELESLVSITTGQPIASTSATDPQGFGLGIAQLTDPELGTFWFYEGETLGFRALHAYFPDTGLIIAIGLNSATADDQSATLMKAVYDTLLTNGMIRP
ncbi:serine hydrolase [Geodermatophilus maliterrae]|uniref:Serine hydrolase n=1 Tax=Geodermatophilus maliterrae TaxID=3162531 RepID=A0ABV3XFL6_9ACTN